MRLAYCLILLLTAPLAFAGPDRAGDPPTVSAVLALGRDSIEEGIERLAAQGSEDEAALLRGFLERRRQNLLRLHSNLKWPYRSLETHQLKEHEKELRKKVATASSQLKSLIRKGVPLIIQLLEAEERLLESQEGGPYRDARGFALTVQDNLETALHFESDLGVKLMEMDSLLLRLAMVEEELGHFTPCDSLMGPTFNLTFGSIFAGIAYMFHVLAIGAIELHEPRVALLCQALTWACSLASVNLGYDLIRPGLQRPITATLRWVRGMRHALTRWRCKAALSGTELPALPPPSGDPDPTQ